MSKILKMWYIKGKDLRKQNDIDRKVHLVIMKLPNEIRIEILPLANNNIFEQRESGLTHSSFHLEYLLYQNIGMGNVKEVEDTISQYLSQGLTIGNLSNQISHQIRYWCITCISIAIHYAILGGLDETDAYNLSDEYIRYIDQIDTMKDAIQYLREKAVELTTAVADARQLPIHSTLIRNCIHYIHIHLHDRLKIADIAEKMKVSRDYLSRRFQKETGVCLHHYILEQKLTESITLLQKGFSYERICYDLGFCSEAHFIQCFKKQFHMTPHQYAKHMF